MRGRELNGDYDERVVVATLVKTDLRSDGGGGAGDTVSKGVWW